jgi:hypothetical protein
MISKIKSTIWIDLLIIFAAGTVTMLVRYQGWKSQELANLDMFPYYQGVQDFLSTGRVLEKGELSSYSSDNPPGTFYLILPGILLTPDPRLQDLAGNTILVYGTLIFLYLVAREVAGRVVALPATVVFALSRLGFMGVYPIGHPIFILASLYFLLLWINRRAAWALGAVVAILAYGLYVDLAIIPFLFVIPVLWLIYRPPLGWKSLLVSGLFGLLIWFPYLRYEYTRGFMDMASLLLMRPENSVWKNTSTSPIYCYATEPGENDVPNGVYLPYIGGSEIQKRVVYPLPGWKNQAAYESCRILMNIDRNFDGDFFLLGANRYFDSILWWVFMTGWITFGWVVMRGWRPMQRIIHTVAVRRKWIPLALAAAGALVFYLLATPAILEQFAADKSIDHNISLAVTQFREYMPWIWLAICLGLYLSVYIPDPNPDNVILFIAFSLPWIILLVLAEPGRPERFWYMWPLQVLVMVLFLRWLVERFHRARPAFWILVIALGVALLPIPFDVERISNGLANGYAGSDSDQWKVAEFLSGEAKTEGVDSLRVEYWLVDSNSPINPLHPENHFSDWFDYLLLVRFSVHNLESTTAGSAGTVWEVVDVQMGPPDSLKGASPVATIGHYSIYQIP